MFGRYPNAEASIEQSIRYECAVMTRRRQFAVRYEPLCDVQTKVSERLHDRIVQGSADPAETESRLSVGHAARASLRRSARAAPDHAHLAAAWAAMTRTEAR